MRSDGRGVPFATYPLLTIAVLAARYHLPASLCKKGSISGFEWVTRVIVTPTDGFSVAVFMTRSSPTADCRRH